MQPTPSWYRITGQIVEIAQRLRDHESIYCHVIPAPVPHLMVFLTPSQYPLVKEVVDWYGGSISVVEVPVVAERELPHRIREMVEHRNLYVALEEEPTLTQVLVKTLDRKKLGSLLAVERARLRKLIVTKLPTLAEEYCLVIQSQKPHG